MDSPKREGFALKSSTLLSPLFLAVTCEKIGKPEVLLSVEEEASRRGPEDPGRSGSLAGHRSLWNGFKDSGRNSRFFEGKAHRPPQERGFHRFFFHGGENPQIPQNPGSFEGEKPKAHGGIRDPMLRENLKTRRWNLPGSCRHRYLRSRPLFEKGVSGIPAKDLILRWASSSLHLQATESSQSVPRGTPKGTPFPAQTKRYWRE